MPTSANQLIGSDDTDWKFIWLSIAIKFMVNHVVDITATRILLAVRSLTAAYGLGTHSSSTLPACCSRLAPSCCALQSFKDLVWRKEKKALTKTTHTYTTFGGLVILTISIAGVIACPYDIILKAAKIARKSLVAQSAVGEPQPTCRHHIHSLQSVRLFVCLRNDVPASDYKLFQRQV